MKSLIDVIRDTVNPSAKNATSLTTYGDDKWKVIMADGKEYVGVLGYKVFDPDWSCRGKQYEVGKSFEETGTIYVCGHGMHYCPKAADCFNYYSFNSMNKVALIMAYGEIETEGDKCCTNKILIIREIPWSELLEIANEGKDNSGLRNTGDSNTGHRNTGHRNTGHRNFGNRCTGDFNIADDSTGVFCSEQRTIQIFDKDSGMTLIEWRKSDAYRLLSNVESNRTEWISGWRMTEEEKKNHPDWEKTDGYLKVMPLDPRRYVKWWERLTNYDKKIIKAIPNFDAEKFKAITGIDVNNSDAHIDCYRRKDRLMPGDKVIIDDLTRYSGPFGANDDMCKLAGKVATITKVCDCGEDEINPKSIRHEIDLDNGTWSWSIAMFSKVL